MSTTELHHNSRELFADFEPPATTDGSYMGIAYQKQAIASYLNEKFDDEFEQAKARLKSAKVKVGLCCDKGSIQLQATLPIKPDDTDTKGKKTKQYKISLGIPANLDGLKTAEEEAYELGKLIARKQFTWTDKYLGRQASIPKQVLTIKTALETFEQEYFKTRKRTIKSEHTYHQYESRIKQHISLDCPMTSDALKAEICKCSSESQRWQLFKILNVLARCFNINIDLSVFKKQPQPKARNIPSDSDIIKYFHEYEKYAYGTPSRRRSGFENNWLFWRWMYGMMATYGLRPREIILEPDINWWLHPDNKDLTWKVSEKCKTGARETLPLYPQWVDLFDLKNQLCIEMLAEKISNFTSFKDCSYAVQHNASWFDDKVQIPFNPYDLRHAWAIRAHLMGIPIKAAADNLGHSVEMHTKVYQKYFGLDNRKKAINEALSKKSDLETLKAENHRLKLEIQLLQLENEKLRQLVGNNTKI